MDEQHLARLEENLRQQLELYRELLETATKKEEVLVANDMRTLDALVAKEETVVILGSKLEKERMTLIEHLASEIGLPVEDVTLVRLVQNYPHLEPLQVELEKVVTAIQSKHALNTELLKQAMRIVEFTLQLLVPAEQGVYSRNREATETGATAVRSARIIDKSV